MKKFLFVGALILMTATPACADQNDTQTSAATQQAKVDYRAYMDQLKTLGKQYKSVTGEIQKVLKEEGVPTINENTGEFSMQPYTAPTATAGISSPIEGVRISETDKDMTVSMDLPGVQKNSIRVQLEDGKTVHVTASRKPEQGAGRVERRVVLPSPAQEKSSRARYEDGVLTVQIPKAASKEVNIPVQ